MSEVVEPVLQKDQLSPEFFGLIHDWDPEASNDDYYVTSSDFIEIHSQLNRTLIRGVLFWATNVCLGMSALAFFYR